MSEETKKAPAIRFQGFTDDWEQRKLIEEADFFDEKRIPIDSEKRVQGRYPYYGATGVIDYVDNYIFDGEYILLAEDGANIITRNSPVAYITEGKFWLNNHAHIMKMKLGSNLFLLQLLERQNYEKFNSGTAQPKLNGQIVKNMIFNFPSYKEQNKIGNFFKLIDEAIALHQRNFALLKRLKEAYLKRMLPQNSENKPLLRSADFSDPWEQRELGEHAQVLTGGTPKTQIKEFWEPKEIPWMSSGEINKKRLFSTDNQISKLGFESSSARWVKVNSVLIALAGQGKTRGTVAINEIPLTTNQSIAAIEPDDSLDSEFLFQNLENRYEELRLASSGDGSRGGLNKQIISDIKIIAPSIQEQRKVGSFFKQLDDTIALHQSKLEKLKDLKQVLLAKMFV